MLFNSIAFLIFLPIVLLGFTLLKRQRVWFLLAASYFFIGWWHWEYLGLIIVSTLVDYYAGRQLGKENQDKRKRILFLGLSLTVNLGLLFFFKYFNFFNGQLESLFQAMGMTYLVPYSDFLLPMGISFYSFQTLSYTIDVYNGKLQPERNLGLFALYVSFFPQLVAGPIERAGNLIDQLRSLKSIVADNFSIGLGRILMGLFKKLVIADRLALFVDPVFDNPQGYDGLLLIIATLFFAFQIYCDFSGYSDIAIGIARIFGVRLMENFKNPYLAQNVRDFWGRWHISLSTWFRDYLYIPLGGGRVSSVFKVRNILIVFLVSGLWHGANWTFVIWGALHGIFLLLGLLFAQIKTAAPTRIQSSSLIRSSEVWLTFMLVCFAWIFFRANSVEDAWYVASAITHIELSVARDILYTFKSVLMEPHLWFNRLNFDFGSVIFQMTNGDFILSLGLIPALVYAEYNNFLNRLKLHSYGQLSVYFLLGFTVLLLGVFTEKQFIYFQF